MRTIKLTYEDAEGCEVEVAAPAVWEICGGCRGEGTRALGGEAFTSSEWAEWDPDDRRAYIAGEYDTPCGECGGAGKVLVVDEDACERNLELKAALAAHREREDAAAEFDEYAALERRMGC